MFLHAKSRPYDNPLFAHFFEETHSPYAGSAGQPALVGWARNFSVGDFERPRFPEPGVNPFMDAFGCGSLGLPWVSIGLWHTTELTDRIPALGIALRHISSRLCSTRSTHVLVARHLEPHHELGAKALVEWSKRMDIGHDGPGRYVHATRSSATSVPRRVGAIGRASK